MNLQARRVGGTERKCVFASSLEQLKTRLSEWIGDEVEISLDSDDSRRKPIDTDTEFNKLPLFYDEEETLFHNSIMAMAPKDNFVIVKNAKRSRTINVPITQLREAQELVKTAFNMNNLPDFYLNERPCEINDAFSRLKPGIILVAIFPGEAWTVSRVIREFNSRVERIQLTVNHLI